MANKVKRTADVTVKIPAETHATITRLAEREQRAIRVIIARAVEVYDQQAADRAALYADPKALRIGRGK
jgi:predicted transcriptional regulator